MPQRKIVETQEITNSDGEVPQKVVKTTTIIPQEELQEPERTYKTKKAIFRTYQVLFYVLGVIEILLTFRLILKLMGASTASGFTRFINDMSGPFAKPFLGIVGSSVSGNSMVEWSTLIAMAVYAVVVWLIIQFFQLVKPIDPEEVKETVDNI